MQLSTNFSLQDLVKSDLAMRLGIDNTPPDALIPSLQRLAESILEPIRAHFGIPFVPNSGYRCLALNRAVKSGDNSQHVKGEAVDVEVPGVANFDLAYWVYKNLPFDQLILECYTPGVPNSGWVHCSYTGQQDRHQVLTMTNGKFVNGLIG
jgi:hypothetical protein